MLRRFAQGSALLIAISASTLAQAGPVDALDAMSDYNLIVFNNFKLNQDVQGSVYVDGNLTDGNMVGSSFSSYTKGPGLVVTGNLTGRNVKVKNSDLYVGGNVTGYVELQDSGNAYVGGKVTGGSARLTGNVAGRTISTSSTVAPPKLDQSDFFDLSSDLARLTADAAYGRSSIKDGNNFKISFTDQDKDGVAVVDLGEGFFSAVSSFGLFPTDVANIDTVVINVAGSHVTVNANWLTGSLGNRFASEHVIWNFFEAQTVTLNRQLFGSVLAPGALLKNTTPIDGSVVADRFDQGGQVHLPGFVGDRLHIVLQTPTGIPEPTAFYLLGLGLFGVAGLRRRSPGPA